MLPRCPVARDKGGSCFREAKRWLAASVNRSQTMLRCHALHQHLVLVLRVESRMVMEPDAHITGVLSEVVKAGAEIALGRGGRIQLRGTRLVPELVGAVRTHKRDILGLLSTIVSPPVPAEAELQTRSVLDQYAVEVRYITDTGEAAQVLARLATSMPLGIDIETAPRAAYRTEWQPVKFRKNGHPYKQQPKVENTAGLDPHRGEIRLIQLYAGDGVCWVIDVFRTGTAVLKPLRRMHLVAHNAQFEALFLCALGIEPQLLHCTRLLGTHFHGSKNASLADAVRAAYQVEIPKALQVSDWAAEALSQAQIEYGALDAVLAFHLYQDYLETLPLACQQSYEISQSCVIPAARMQLAGIGFDQDAHRQVVTGWENRKRALEGPLRANTGIQNPRSAPQVAAWLETALPADVIADWPRSEKTGLLETGKNALLAQALDIEDLRPLVELKQMLTRLSGFGEKMHQLIMPTTGRIHASLKICGTKTGRFSCARPNLQQQPRPDATGNMRACFVAPPGRMLIGADYSQAELRAVAEVAPDETMRATFSQGKDIHTATAALISGKSLDRVTRSERASAKAVAFGLLYGMGASSLRSYAYINWAVEMSLMEAEQVRNLYMDAYPGVQAWQERQRDLAFWGETVKTRMGRTYYPQWEAAGQISPQLACNFPIQGVVGEIGQMALYRIDRALSTVDTGDPRLLLQVHDEFLVECREDPEVLAAVKRVVEEEMVAAFLDAFPNAPVMGLVDAKVGRSWADVH